MKLNRTEQALAMVDSLLLHCDCLEAAACRNIGRPNESVLIKKWDPKLLGWLGYENANNLANIWIRPPAEQLHPWLFIDDLPLTTAIKLTRKYQCIVIETSQGNCQVRLLAKVGMSKIDRKIVQVSLVKLLGADVGSTAGCKWGRLPGFRNRKPDRDAWTNLIAVPDPSLPRFDVSPYLPYLNCEISTTKVVVCVSTSAMPTNICSTKTNKGDDGLDQSGNDYGYILNRLRFFKLHGHDYLAEAKRLESELCHKNKTRKRNPLIYSQLTVTAVLKVLNEN